jgi:hypothetical protein
MKCLTLRSCIKHEENEQRSPFPQIFSSSQPRKAPSPTLRRSPISSSPADSQLGGDSNRGTELS